MVRWAVLFINSLNLDLLFVHSMGGFGRTLRIRIKLNPTIWAVAIVWTSIIKCHSEILCAL
jgi:hypothetical protein